MFIVYIQDVALLKSIFEVINFLQKNKNNDRYVFYSTPSRHNFSISTKFYKRNIRKEISWITANFYD